MPRSLMLGNGNMLCAFDERLQLRDLYYPYVGMEDHTEYGDLHRVGVWIQHEDGSTHFSWLSDGDWEVKPLYKPDTLVGHSVLKNDELGLLIQSEDHVHPVRNILMRHFRITSTDGRAKEVRVFFHHDFHIYGDKQKDTAFYEPYTNTVIHYRGQRYFLVGGQTSHPTECRTGHQGGEFQSILHSKTKTKRCGISSWSIGKSEYQGLEGTWRDAEDGELSEASIEQGSVDSTIAIHCTVSPDTETSVEMWLCLGKNIEEVVEAQEFIFEESPTGLARNSHNYWKSWVNKTKHNFGSLSEAAISLYKRSLLLIRLHADNHGGLIAAADADIMMFNKDTYTYVWPRDGAFVSLALDKAGYLEVTRRFFEFCDRVQTPDGYLLHKYNPDGSYGSSWHAWYRDGEAQLPIQEDETALVLHALWHHFEQVQDFEFLQRMYETFIKKAANFLCDYREEETGLPLASYDPWEEHRGIFTYTTATTIAGLTAAARICHVLGHFTHSEKYQTAADEMRQALLFHLYDEQTGRFVKKIKRKDGQTIEQDLTPDASLVAVWKLGVLPVDEPRVASTMQQLDELLTVQTSVGGWARYTNDYYHSVTEPTKEVPGNPWIITTLWKAQYLIANANTPMDLESAKEILEWVVGHASASGILPEQLNPLDGAPLSVAPLTWSHATYVETVLMFAEKEAELSDKR